jgi:TRAP-type C4-dicarboxylate transport system permease small subunit
MESIACDFVEITFECSKWLNCIIHCFVLHLCFFLDWIGYKYKWWLWQTIATISLGISSIQRISQSI